MQSIDCNKRLREVSKLFYLKTLYTNSKMTNSEIQEKSKELIRKMTGGSSLASLGMLVNDQQYDEAILLVKRIPQTTSGSNQAKIAFIHLMKDAIVGTTSKVEKPVPPVINQDVDTNKEVSKSILTATLMTFNNETGLFSIGATKFAASAVEAYINDSKGTITVVKQQENGELEQVGFAAINIDKAGNVVASIATNDENMTVSPIVDGAVIDTDLIEVIEKIEVEIVQESGQ